MVSQEMLVYIDGRYHPASEAKISVFDHGLLYGDGVFEGIRTYNGVVFRLREHIDRLYNSARFIHLQISLSKEEMIEAVLTTLRKNRLSNSYIRLVVTRGPGDLGIDPRLCRKPSVIIITEPVKFVKHNPNRIKGLSMIISSVRRDSVDSTTHEAKSLNYMNSILARIEAIEAGVDDAIMLDSRGFVSEGTVTNIFIVEDGRISTPSTASALLHGVTRGRILKMLRALGYDTAERDITPYELINANEVFAVGTKSEVVPVVKIVGRLIGEGRVGKVTANVMKEFSRIVGDPSEGIPIYS